MLFVGLAILAIVVVPLLMTYFWNDDYFISLVLTSLATLVLGVLLIIPVFALGGLERSRADDLSAISGGSSPDGSFFLGSGYVDGIRILNYTIQNEDGGFELESAPASASTIFEVDTEKPRVTIIEWTHYEIAWLTPFQADGSKIYIFTVPPGSVLQDYAIGGK